jgi:hypothetical protein
MVGKRRRRNGVMVRVKSYEEVVGGGLEERKKSFNVQCYCDVREFEAIASGLVEIGVLDAPVRTSTVLNEILRCMCRTMMKNGQAQYHRMPSKAVERLREIGVAVGQFGDKRDRATARHLQQEHIEYEIGQQSTNVGRSRVATDDVEEAVRLVEERRKESEAEEVEKLKTALGVRPEGVEEVKEDEGEKGS